MLICFGFAVVDGEFDGEEDMIGIGAHDAFDRVFFQELPTVGFELEIDLRATRKTGCLFFTCRRYSETVRAIGVPDVRIGGSCFAGDDVDLRRRP